MGRKIPIASRLQQGLIRIDPSGEVLKLNSLPMIEVSEKYQEVDIGIEF